MLVRTRARLLSGPIKVPLSVDKVLRVRAETSRAHVSANRYKVLVQAVLDIVFRRRRRLHLGGFKTIRRFGERALC